MACKAWQEVFDRPDLRKLAEAYAKGAGGLDARAGLGPAPALGRAWLQEARAARAVARRHGAARQRRRSSAPVRRTFTAPRKPRAGSGQRLVQLQLRHRCKARPKPTLLPTGFGPKSRAPPRPPTSAPRSPS